MKFKWYRQLMLSLTLGTISMPLLAVSLQQGLSLEVVEPCYVLKSHDSSLALFNQQQNRMQGWSHIQPNMPLYKPLQHAADYYQITPQNIHSSAECEGQRHYQAVLVKRYRDWSQQHANGIEPLVNSENATFEDFPYIDMLVRFNASDSHLLSPKELITHFGPWLSDGQIQQWDRGQINVELTLFSLQDDGISFAAGSILNLPTQYFDQWLHLRIDARKLTLYREQHYQRTPIEWAELKAKKITGVRINPETANGKTLRHYQLDAFDPDQPEFFKETGLSIRGLYLNSAK
ncbi:hypothetical protein QX776_15265 [Alteromonadaceae bacterium BrNp21-10]|nr:hypothetical protein [Alteromonadaceae bacterium BrNp21-10]